MNTRVGEDLSTDATTLVTLPGRSEFIARMVRLDPAPDLISGLYRPFADEIAGRRLSADRVVEAVHRRCRTFAYRQADTRRTAALVLDGVMSMFEIGLAVLVAGEPELQAMGRAWVASPLRTDHGPPLSLTGTPDELHREWRSLRKATDPVSRRRFVEITVALSVTDPDAIAEVTVPVLAVCPRCARVREIASPIGLMDDHGDPEGRHCPGSITRPTVLTGDGLIQALLDREANERGEFCRTGRGDPRHDPTRCPGRDCRP